MQIGLFFGSFNPVHTGHLIIASYMADNTLLDEIWFVVSPQNPFKETEQLLDENIRLKLLNLAIENDKRFRSIDIEFNLPRPSYTENTLVHLGQLYPEHNFILIIGGDNLQSFHKWKNYENIITNYKVFVYSRAGSDQESIVQQHAAIQLFEVPLLSISSTYIRETIKAGKSIRYLVPEAVRLEIESKHLYS